MKRMIEYRLTKEKVLEHLGEETILRHTHPEKTKFMRLHKIIFGIFFGFFAIWFYFDGRIITALVFLGLAFIIPNFFVILAKHPIDVDTDDIEEKMKSIVSDPQLQWLNKQKDITTIPTRLGRIGPPNLKEEDYKVLSYLKKNKTGQGLRKVLPSLKDSNSENVKLKRLATRGYIKKVGNDYEYTPWTFKIINDKTPEARVIEQRINQAWERMIDEKKNEPLIVVRTN